MAPAIPAEMARQPADAPSALFVTTVPITLEAFLAPFAEHFRARGWRIDALANGATAVPQLEGSFDRRYDVAWSRNPLDPRNLVGSAARVRALVAENGYDIVHVHTPVAAFVTRFALRGVTRGTRPARIYTAHGFHFYEGGRPAGNTAFRTIERLAAQWTDYLVTINEPDFREARRFPGIDPGRVRLIPGIGVDLDRYAPSPEIHLLAEKVRRDLDIAPDAFVLTIVAELAPVKRHAHLLDAFATAMRDGLPPDTVLLVVGEGPLESRLREKAVALGIADRMRWAGYRRDIPAVLAATDALALVSEREGLPRSVLEAMAAGVPVIGTRTRGITDAVGESAGWIAEKHDVAELATLIRHAATHPDDLRATGMAARERAHEFALPRIIDAYEELYREALASTV